MGGIQRRRSIWAITVSSRRPNVSKRLRSGIVQTLGREAIVDLLSVGKCYPHLEIGESRRGGNQPGDAQPALETAVATINCNCSSAAWS